jgi:hypothetical protein
MARNIFAQEGSWLPNVQRGIEAANAFDDRIRSRRASTRAAPMIASGDYQGAAGVYGEAGLADDALTLRGQAEGLTRQARADERQAMQDKRQETTDERELVKARVEGLRGIMQDIAQVPQGQRLGAWRRRAPELVAQGYPQEVVDSQTEADLSDAELQAFGAQLEEEWQAVNLGAGGFASFNKRSNTLDVKREPDPRLLVLGENRVAVDPKTREVVARGPNKTFAPRAPGRSGATSGGRSLGAQLPEGY